MRPLLTTVFLASRNLYSSQRPLQLKLTVLPPSAGKHALDKYKCSPGSVTPR